MTEMEIDSGQDFRPQPQEQMVRISSIPNELMELLIQTRLGMGAGAQQQGILGTAALVDDCLTMKLKDGSRVVCDAAQRVDKNEKSSSRVFRLKDKSKKATQGVIHTTESEEEVLTLTLMQTQHYEVTQTNLQSQRTSMEVDTDMEHTNVEEDSQQTPRRSRRGTSTRPQETPEESVHRTTPTTASRKKLRTELVNALAYKDVKLKRLVNRLGDDHDIDDIKAELKKISKRKEGVCTLKDEYYLEVDFDIAEYPDDVEKEVRKRMLDALTRLMETLDKQDDRRKLAKERRRVLKEHDSEEMFVEKSKEKAKSTVKDDENDADNGEQDIVTKKSKYESTKSDAISRSETKRKEEEKYQQFRKEYELKLKEYTRIYDFIRTKSNELTEMQNVKVSLEESMRWKRDCKRLGVLNEQLKRLRYSMDKDFPGWMKK